MHNRQGIIYIFIYQHIQYISIHRREIDLERVAMARRERGMERESSLMFREITPPHGWKQDPENHYLRLTLPGNTLYTYIYDYESS